jgi:NADPH2:quinone reductase
VLRWLSEGALRPRIDSTFGLEDAAQAHRVLESRGTIGKVLLLPRQRPQRPAKPPTAPA